MKKMDPFLEGVLSVFSFGMYPPIKKPMTPEEARKADAEAIASDWKAVVDDFRVVLGEVDKPEKR